MPPGHRPDPPADTIRISVEGNNSGLPWNNIFWVKTDEVASSSSSISDLLDAFATKMTASNLWSACCLNTVHVTALRGVCVTSPGNALTAVRTMALNGAVAGADLTAASCAVVSWQSTAYWRGGKPRTYLPGLPGSFGDTNHSLNDTQKATILSNAGAFRSGVNAITTPAFDSVQLGFIHWQNNGEWLTPPVFYPFTGQLVHDRIGVQRRRLGQWLA